MNHNVFKTVRILKSRCLTSAMQSNLDRALIVFILNDVRYVWDCWDFKAIGRWFAVKRRLCRDAKDICDFQIAALSICNEKPEEAKVYFMDEAILVDPALVIAIGRLLFSGDTRQLPAFGDIQC